MMDYEDAYDEDEFCENCGEYMCVDDCPCLTGNVWDVCHWCLNQEALE